MKEKINFDNAFLLTLWTFVTGLVIFFLTIMFSSKPVNGYYLGSNGTTPAIKVDIENDADETIVLHDVSYKEAVELINELNKSLEK